MGECVFNSNGICGDKNVGCSILQLLYWSLRDALVSESVFSTMTTPLTGMLHFGGRSALSSGLRKHFQYYAKTNCTNLTLKLEGGKGGKIRNTTLVTEIGAECSPHPSYRDQPYFSEYNIGELIGVFASEFSKRSHGSITTITTR